MFFFIILALEVNEMRIIMRMPRQMYGVTKKDIRLEEQQEHCKKVTEMSQIVQPSDEKG